MHGFSVGLTFEPGAILAESTRRYRVPARFSKTSRGSSGLELSYEQRGTCLAARDQPGEDELGGKRIHRVGNTANFTGDRVSGAQALVDHEVPLPCGFLLRVPGLGVQMKDDPHGICVLLICPSRLSLRCDMSVI